MDPTSFIISRVNEEDYKEGIEEKVQLSRTIIEYNELLSGTEEFYEEECHLSLLNWACDSLKEQSVIDINLESLLYNILTIFEIFPINSKDLISLNFIEKLNKIKRRVIKKAGDKDFSPFVSRIDRLINYWVKLFSFFQKSDSENDISLGQKRSRDSSDNLSNISANDTEAVSSTSTSGKSVKFKENLVEVVEFDPSDQIPV